MTTITTSGIDITKPNEGDALTSDVRDNFSAIKDQLDTIANGNLETTQLIIGEPGTEGTGININGTTYDSQLKISDIDNQHLAELIVHRHSTTYQPLMIFARANSDTSSHSAVTAAQVLSSIYAAGWTGSHYDLFGESRFSVGTGSISSTSSPGKWTLLLAPDGSNVPAAVITADSDKSVVLGGTLTASNGGSLTGTWSDLGTVTTVDINGGTLDGVTIGATSAPTVTNLGSVATCDINGGTIDGTTIGSTNVFPADMIIQHAYTQDGAVTTGTTTTPLDDTIPQQSTEGDTYLSVSIQPKYSDSLLVIEALWNGATNATGTLTCALHQDSTENALASVWKRCNFANTGLQMYLTHTMTSGTTSSTTFKLNVGNSNAATTTFNGQGGSRYFGGTMGSSIRVIEVKQ